MRKHLIFISLLLLPILGLADESEGIDIHTIRGTDIPRDAPRFEQFSVHEVFAGRPTTPDVHTQKRARLFRTSIREGAEMGPNFAGHYTIVGWGCGAMCQSIAIVDARTGKVFFPAILGNVDHANIAYDEFDPPDGALIQYRKNSKLLIVIGGINDDPRRRGISYFLWDQDQLRRIRFVAKPYE
jgi:hypothetical protein